MSHLSHGKTFIAVCRALLNICCLVFNVSCFVKVMRTFGESPSKLLFEIKMTIIILILRPEFGSKHLLFNQFECFGGVDK